MSSIEFRRRLISICSSFDFAARAVHASATRVFRVVRRVDCYPRAVSASISYDLALGTARCFQIAIKMNGLLKKCFFFTTGGVCLLTLVPNVVDLFVGLPSFSLCEADVDVVATNRFPSLSLLDAYVRPWFPWIAFIAMIVHIVGLLMTFWEMVVGFGVIASIQRIITAIWALKALGHLLFSLWHSFDPPIFLPAIWFHLLTQMIMTIFVIGHRI